MKKITKELVLSFKTHLIEQEKSANTIEKYVRDVTLFMMWLHGREITMISALEYKNTLCEKYAPSSVNAAKTDVKMPYRAVLESRPICFTET
ncbi:MAG: site-specific integrase [Clostridia bacterium]|nr:site-specific integrase [Clostridia bacterium]